MGRMANVCLQSVLKLVNSVIGMIGIGMILYSMWMLRAWYKQIHGFWSEGPDSYPRGKMVDAIYRKTRFSTRVFRSLFAVVFLSSFPVTLLWFIYTFLALGVSLCVIACSGHIAAETANGPCISCYTVFVFLLVMVEAAVTADVFLNKNWEEDFPADPTGRFDEFKDFVKSNLKMCKWIGIMIVGAQALAIFLAMVLRALGPDRERDYDSDDDYIPTRLPLLRNHQNPAYVAVDPRANKEPWSVRIQDKMNM